MAGEDLLTAFAVSTTRPPTCCQRQRRQNCLPQPPLRSQTARVEELLYLPANDGLLARKSGDWAKRKHHYLRNYCGITTKSMRKKWRLVYLDVMAGPGLCTNKETGEEFPGSPFIAWDHEFDQFILIEEDLQLADALDRRIRRHPKATLVEVIARNWVEVLESGRLRFSDDELVVAFVDPMGISQVPMKAIGPRPRNPSRPPPGPTAPASDVRAVAPTRASRPQSPCRALKSPQGSPLARSRADTMRGQEGGLFRALSGACSRRLPWTCRRRRWAKASIPSTNPPTNRSHNGSIAPCRPSSPASALCPPRCSQPILIPCSLAPLPPIRARQRLRRRYPGARRALNEDVRPIVASAERQEDAADL